MVKMLNDEKEFSTKNKGVELDCELLLLPALFWNIFLPVGVQETITWIAVGFKLYDPVSQVKPNPIRKILIGPTKQRNLNKFESNPQNIVESQTYC